MKIDELSDVKITDISANWTCSIPTHILKPLVENHLYWHDKINNKSIKLDYVAEIQPMTTNTSNYMVVYRYWNTDEDTSPKCMLLEHFLNGHFKPTE